MDFMRCTLSANKATRSAIAGVARAVGLTIPTGQKPRLVAPAGRIRLMCRMLPDLAIARHQLWTEEAADSIDESILRLVKRPKSAWTPKKIVTALASVTATRLNIHKATARDFVEDAICGLLASEILQWREGRLRYVSS